MASRQFGPRGRRHYKIRVDPTALLDEGLSELLLDYALRLSRALSLSDDFLAFALTAIGNQARASFMTSLIEGAIALGHSQDPDDQPSGRDATELVEWVLSLGRHMRGPEFEALIGTSLDLALAAAELARPARDAGSERSAYGRLGDGATRFARVFELDEVDVALLRFWYALEQSETLMALFEGSPLSQKPRFLAICLQTREAAILHALASSGALLRSGLVRRDEDDTLTCVYVSPMLLDGLAGLSGSLSHERFCNPGKGARFGVEDFSIPPETIRVLRALVAPGKSANILLYGPPGTGKTEFARSLASDRGMRAWFLGTGDAIVEKDRRSALRLAAASLDPEADLLVVDEAEGLLSAGKKLFLGPSKADKAWINDFLESPGRLIIWIVNWTDFMDESALRRFSLSIRFERFGARERERSWRASAKEAELDLDEDLLRRLSYDYESTAGGIAQALGLLKRVSQADPGLASEGVLRLALDAQSSLGAARKAARMNPPRAYDPEALQTDVAWSDIATAITTWQARRSGGGTRGLRCLFWGAPGTGKTEAARHLAELHGLSVVVRRASDLLDMYVGQTEKHIAEAFREAEREGSLLLIDEADSFLRAREGATRSWEVTQVNEFLTQMETFSGVLVCSTNLIDGLDKAALRRFQIKVAFKPLSGAALLRLLARYFPGIVPPENTEAALAGFDGIVTPGDLAALADRLDYLGGEPSWDRIIEGLRAECAYRARKPAIGFSTAS